MEQNVLNNKNNTNCLWKAKHSYLPKMSKSQGSYTKDHKFIANEFNEYFANVGNNTIDKIIEMAN